MPYLPLQMLSTHSVMIDWRSLRPFENCSLTPPLSKDTSYLILLLQINFSPPKPLQTLSAYIIL